MEATWIDSWWHDRQPRKGEGLAPPPMTDSRNILRRYTDLASLLDILKRRAITLLPPSTWDDRNDRLMMRTYAKVQQVETLLALCMTHKAETYHHWKVFTDKNNGVCIHLHKAALIAAMKQQGVSVRPVKYMTISALKQEDIPVRQLPFLKRSAFGDEGEYRAVYEKKEREHELKRVNVNFDVIERITLNPWMPQAVAESIVDVIGGISRDAPFDVVRSNLIDSRSWRAFASGYAEPDLA